jgi:hypothetical protein
MPVAILSRLTPGSSSSFSSLVPPGDPLLRKALSQLVSRMSQQMACDSNALRERLEVPLLEVRRKRAFETPQSPVAVRAFPNP